MQLHGQNIIGYSRISSAMTFHAHNAHTGEPMPVPFFAADLASVNRAFELAEAAFVSGVTMDAAARATLLDQIAVELEASRENLIAIAGQETGLPAMRLTGELARTTSQLRA